MSGSQTKLVGYVEQHVTGDLLEAGCLQAGM